MKSQGWLVVLFALVSLGAGCAKDAGSDTNDLGATNGWSAFPVEVYAGSNVTSSPEAMSDFNEALAFWETKAGRKLFNYKGSWAVQNNPYTGPITSIESVVANVVMFSNPWPFAQGLAGMTIALQSEQLIQGAIVLLNSAITMCAGDCTGTPGVTSQRRAFAHELGHFLGMGHSQDTGNIMYPQLQVGASLATVTIDEEAFKGLIEK